jgi:NAD(P)-dependent dehydrogenase (short-subunit alcohol dehydrogenase family)
VVTTIVSTDGVARGEREAFWRQALSETFVPMTVAAVTGDRFAGSLRSAWLGRLMVAAVASTAQDIQRTCREISRTDAEYLQIGMVYRGAATVAQDGRHAVLGAGDFAVFESTRPFRWTSAGDWDVNMFGALAVTRAFRRRCASHILNVASVLGRFALPGSGLYAASKFALEAASDAMRIELAPFGVRVVLVEPGVIATPLYERAATLAGYQQALQPYRGSWPGRLGFPQRLLRAAASVDTIAATLAEAALAARPRPRYRPGRRNRLTTRLLTTLPPGRRIGSSADHRRGKLRPLAAPGPDGAAPTQPRASANDEGADATGAGG